MTKFYLIGKNGSINYSFTSFDIHKTAKKAVSALPNYNKLLIKVERKLI